MRRFLLSLFGLTSFAPFTVATIDIHEIYTYYIHTDDYAAMVGPQILPVPCLSILERKFQGLWTENFFEDALLGRNCHVPLPKHPLSMSTPLVNTSILNIPLDDYIASTEVAEMIKQFLDSAFAIGPKWPSGHRESNYLAYRLFTELSFKSDCDHIDCRVFRKMVEQTHYQLSVMIKTGNARSKFDVLLPMDLLGELTKQIGRAIELSLTTTPTPTRRFSCGFWCFRTVSTTTTTSSPTPLAARIAWDAQHAKRTILKLHRIADEKLDEKLLELGRWSMANDLPHQLKSMQTIFMPEIIGLTLIVSRNPATDLKETTDALLQLVFDLLGDIEGAKSIDDWPSIFDSARESIFTLRYTFQFLP